MKRFKIELKKQSYRINQSGLVVGNIFFNVDGWYFPDENWNDFVVRILYWFSQKIIKLKINHNKLLELPFMEGNFKISLCLDSEEQVTIHFIEGDEFSGQSEIILNTIIIPFDYLKTEVKKACESILVMKAKQEIEFEYDFKELKDSYDLLCKL